MQKSLCHSHKLFPTYKINGTKYELWKITKYSMLCIWYIYGFIRVVDWITGNFKQICALMDKHALVNIDLYTIFKVFPPNRCQFQNWDLSPPGTFRYIISLHISRLFSHQENGVSAPLTSLNRPSFASK